MMFLHDFKPPGAHDAQRIRFEFCMSSPGIAPFFDNDAAADQESAQAGRARAGDRRDHGDRACRNAAAIQVEDRDVGLLARRQRPDIAEFPRRERRRRSPSAPRLRPLPHRALHARWVCQALCISQIMSAVHWKPRRPLRAKPPRRGGLSRPPARRPSRGGSSIAGNGPCRYLCLRESAPPQIKMHQMREPPSSPSQS